MSDSEPLRMSEACKRIGWAKPDSARKLRKIIRAKERLLGKKLLTPLSDRPGCQHGITFKMLKRHFGELFAREPNEMLPAFRLLLKDLDQRMRDHIETAVEPRFTETDAKIDTLADAILKTRKDLEKQIQSAFKTMGQ